MVEYDVDFIKETMISLVDEADEKGYTILINKKGDVIANTSYKDEYLNSFSNNAKFTNGLTYKDISKQISQRKPEGGGAIAYINNTKRIIEYRPINLKDWSIVVISDDVLNTLIRNISSVIQYILAGMVVTFFIFLAVIIRLKRKGVREIEAVAFYDELTGLSNLVNFKEQSKELLKKYPTMQFVMQKMDIKDFKAVNEMFGHDVGDMVIKRIASTMTGITEPTFICARVGADQFLMMAGNGFLAQDDTARDAYEEHFRSLIPELEGHEFSFRYGRYFLEKGENNVMEIISRH